MILINLQNVEELIFKDRPLRDKFPDLRHIFDPWVLSYRIPFMGQLRQQSLLDFLHQARNEHLQILEQHFKDTVVLDRVDYEVVKNIKFDLGCDIPSYADLDDFINMAASRDANNLYMSFWK